MPLRIHDESIAVLRRAWASRDSEPQKLDGMARLDALARIVEHELVTEADVASTIHRERRSSRSLDGRIAEGRGQSPWLVR